MNESLLFISVSSKYFTCLVQGDWCLLLSLLSFAGVVIFITPRESYLLVSPASNL